jgi:hypothetical protein
VISASERRRNRGGSPYGVVRAAVLLAASRRSRPGRGRGIKLGWLPTSGTASHVCGACVPRRSRMFAAKLLPRMTRSLSS